MNISQSLIKEVLKHDHCPRLIYLSFIEGKEIRQPSEAMILGRYFESELLGACRGGEKQEPRYLKGGGKAQPFIDVDINVQDARILFDKLGIKINGVQEYIKAGGLSAALDLLTNDFQSDGQAIYDVKWTATAEDDRWNGWANIENKEDAIIQARHYVLAMYNETGKWLPFYFLIFGKSGWAKIIQVKMSPAAIETHKQLIANTAATIKEYALNNYEGRGSYNKCMSCFFSIDCKNKVEIPEIEILTL